MLPLTPIRTKRDICLLTFAENEVLVVACDSAGGVGPKALDRVRVNGEAVGRYTARVALMEVLSVAAVPFLLIGTLPVEPDPTATRVMKGIRSELQRTKIRRKVTMLVSTEKNFPVRQTGVGVAVIATTPRSRLRFRKSRAGDIIAAIGTPCVGAEVLLGEKKGKIAEPEDLAALLKSHAVHDILPVGSAGIRSEARVLAEDSGLGFTLLKHPAVNVTKSAGPATVLLCTIAASNWEHLRSVTAKPLTRIGMLHASRRRIG